MKSKQLQNFFSKHFPEQQTLVEQLISMTSVNNNLPNAVVYGVYNSGKSSLLNSLTGHVEAEYFPTRDVPETKVAKQLEHQGICYIDTPGLDVDEHDTAAANSGAFKADIIIFVHRLGAGPIQQTDLSAISKLAKSHSKPENIIFVITESEVADENKKLIDNITQQVQKAVSTRIQPFLVSNTMFIKGVRSGKSILINKSGIPELLQQLQVQAKSLSKDLQQERKLKIDHLKKQILEKLKQQKNKLEVGIEIDLFRSEMYEHGFVQAVSMLQLTLMQEKIEQALVSTKSSFENI